MTCGPATLREYEVMCLSPCEGRVSLCKQTWQTNLSYCDSDTLRACRYLFRCLYMRLRTVLTRIWTCGHRSGNVRRLGHAASASSTLGSTASSSNLTPCSLLASRRAVIVFGHLFTSAHLTRFFGACSGACSGEPFWRLLAFPEPCSS